jgi:hypothetical protein
MATDALRHTGRICALRPAPSPAGPVSLYVANSELPADMLVMSRPQLVRNSKEEAMRSIARFPRLSGAVVLAACCALLVTFASSAGAAGPTTISFTETTKGATYTNVDVAPKAKKDEVSPGDEIVFRIPLVAGGKKIGHESGVCVATKAAKKFPNVEFFCTGTFVFPGEGRLAFSQMFKLEQSNSGAIVGGTGAYAGARGTFHQSKETKTGSNVTVTLLE